MKKLKLNLKNWINFIRLKISIRAAYEYKSLKNIFNHFIVYLYYNKLRTILKI